MSLVVASQNRGKTFDIVINDVDGNAITPGANDKIRAVIGRLGEIGSDFSGAQLRVSSDVVTANGSSFTKNSPSDGTNRLRLDASDLDFNPGIYSLIIDYFDAADTQEWKQVDLQVFHLEENE